MDEEQKIPKSELQKEQVELAASCGLQKIRKYGDKQFRLVGVVAWSDGLHHGEFEKFVEGLKRQGRSVKIEKRALAVAAYVRAN